MKRSPVALLLVALLLFSSAWLSAADDEVAESLNWPQWRGPDGTGVSSAKNPPLRWSATKNVLWKAPLPGPAGSTPAVWGDRIYLTSVAGDDLQLLCFDTAGKQLWVKTVATGNTDVRADEGNSASPSPMTDGKHVWCFFANGALACYTADGEEVWKFNVEDRFGKLDIAFGMTSTPVLDGDRLYVQLIHGEGNPETREATIACLDAATGATIWKADRPSDAHSECEHSYASPVLYRDGGLEYLITHGADYVVAHRLKDGSEIWRCGDLNPKGDYNPTLRFVASPAANEGLIVVPTAKNGKVVGIKPTAQGDVTHSEEAIAWTMPRNTPDVPSPVIKEGYVYLLRENGNLIVLDAKTGEQKYEERTVRDRHRSSPVWADGKIYAVARNGMVSVVKAGPEFELLAQNEIGEPITASPVIVNGRIYLRTFDSLWAIGEK